MLAPENHAGTKRQANLRRHDNLEGEYKANMGRRPERDIPLTRQELADLQKQFGTMSESALQTFYHEAYRRCQFVYKRRRQDQCRNWSPFGSICGNGSAGGESKRCPGRSRLVWLKEPYQYGIMICMKKTLNIEDKLLKEAKLASGAATDTEAVRLGLEALVRRAAYERLRTLRGSEPLAEGVPRRREKTATTKRRVA